MKEHETIGQLLQQVATYGERPLLYALVEEEWVVTRANEFVQQVEELALGLVELGIQPGDRVGILADSSPRWSIADFAISSMGAISVPLFANISDDHFLYEIKHAEVRYIFIAGDRQWEVFDKHQERFAKAIAMDTPLVGHRVERWEHVLEKGRARAEREPGCFQQLLDAQTGDTTASIVFTSGSTGLPKGAELSHRNLVGLVHMDPFGWDSEHDRYLGLLPLAHIFPRILNYVIIGWGIPLYYLNELTRVGAVAKELHPTVVVLVPRLLEKIHAKMLSRVSASSTVKRLLGSWAFELASDEGVSLYKQVFHPIADKIVYSALRESLGGELRVIISGGAPLDPHLCHFFVDVGLKIYEGWGMTESCPISVNRIGRRKIGSVGEVLGDLEVTSSEEGELLVRGRNVMKGYWEDPERTARTLDREGWLHTGDRGRVEDGYVWIEGRMKELYKTSTGKYVAPIPIEQALCKSPLIDMSMVVAEGKPYTTCLLFPDREILESLKLSQGADNLTDEEFLRAPFVHERMAKVLERVNGKLDQWESVQRYRFILEPLTIEAGLLTPTMKIRREEVTNRFSEEIDALYEERE